MRIVLRARGQQRRHEQHSSGYMSCPCVMSLALSVAAVPSQDAVFYLVSMRVFASVSLELAQSACLPSDARRAVYSCPDAPPLVTCLRIHVTPLWFQFCADSSVHSPAPRSLLHGALWMTWLHLNHFHCPSEYFGRSRPPAARRPRAGDPGRDPDLPLAS